VEARVLAAVKVRQRVAVPVHLVHPLHKDAARGQRAQSQLKTPSRRAAILRSRRL